jgi:hypothetical protein
MVGTIRSLNEVKRCRTNQLGCADIRHLPRPHPASSGRLVEWAGVLSLETQFSLNP